MSQRNSMRPPTPTAAHLVLPVDFWLPDKGWIEGSALNKRDLQRAIKHADRHANADRQVSRWRHGTLSAIESDCAALADFPPGPRDIAELYPILSEAVDSGMIVPLNRFRKGQRIFRGASVDPSDGA